LLHVLIELRPNPGLI